MRAALEMCGSVLHSRPVPSARRSKPEPGGAQTMKKVATTTWVIVAMAGLLLGSSITANAGGKDEKAIRDVENKIITATSSAEVMKYYDTSDIDLFDFVPPLQYKGADAVRGDLGN